MPRRVAALLAAFVVLVLCVGTAAASTSDGSGTLRLSAKSCESFSDVPSNEAPTSDYFDDTGGLWRGWGVSAGERCKPLAGVSFRLTSSVDGNAVNPKQPAFVPIGSEDQKVTTTSGRTSSDDGSIELRLSDLTRPQQQAVQIRDGLWVAASDLSGQFASLRCTGDSFFADNLEVVRNKALTDYAECIVYVVIPRTANPALPPPVVEQPKPVTPAPPISVPTTNGAPQTTTTTTGPTVAPTPAPVTDPPAIPPAVPTTVPTPTPPSGTTTSVTPPTAPSTTAPTSTTAGVSRERTGALILFLEVTVQPKAASTAPWTGSVAVGVDCGPQGRRAVRADVVSEVGSTFATAAPIELPAAARCSVGWFDNPVPAGENQLVVLGRRVGQNEVMTIDAKPGEQSIIPVRVNIGPAPSEPATPPQSQDPSSTVRPDVGKGKAPVSSPSAQGSSAGSKVPQAAIGQAPIPGSGSTDGPGDIPASTELVLLSLFSLGLVLAGLASRRSAVVSLL